jgi:hypothetical protein
MKDTLLKEETPDQLQAESGSRAPICSPRIKFIAGPDGSCDGWATGLGDSAEDAILDFLQNYAEDWCNEMIGDDPDWNRVLELEVWRCKHREDCEEWDFDCAEEEWDWIGIQVVERPSYRCEPIPNPRYPDLPDWEYSKEND